MRFRTLARISVWAIAAATLASSGCAMPESHVSVVDEKPAIVVVGASETAILRVDGIEAGLASAYSGERSLTVLPGRHVVEVLEGQSVVLRKEIFLDGGATQTLSVPKGQ